jgi:hypothetical protein
MEKSHPDNAWKGKGHFVESLRIIQLVEADLNFVLHTI